MRTAAERKETARQFLKEYANTGPKTKARAFRNDDQAKIIPQHGPRGRGRLGAPNPPVSKSIQMSSAFSTYLADSVFSRLFEDKNTPKDETAKIVVNDIAADSTGMPVILDTSVVVAGLFSLRTGSPSRRLMELALADGEEIVPCVTNAIVYEYRRVLEMFGDDRLEQLYRLLFRSIVIPVLPDIEIPQVEADHSDTPFVQALVLTMRELKGTQRPLSRLATNDHNLLNMSTAEDSTKLLHGRIVTPGDILRELHR